MERKNAVIVAYGRSAIAKAIKGSLRYTGCVDFGSQVLKGILAKNPGFDPALAEDLICGCAIPEAEQGLNIENMTNKSRGDVAYTIIDLSGKADSVSLDMLKAIEGVIRVRILQD